MKELNVSELTDNLFDAIGKEWMLVTAGTPEKFNTMTASWGGTGVLWGKPVAFVFIRPERYTYEFIEAGETLTLSFLGADHKDVHKVCGSTSGRTTDKVKAAGLHPFFTSTEVTTASPLSGDIMSPHLAAYSILKGTRSPFLSSSSVTRDRRL